MPTAYSRVELNFNALTETVACCLCADADALPKPSFSDNLIYENRRDVNYVVSHPIQQEFNSPEVNFQPITVTLKRGTVYAASVVPYMM